MIVVGGTYDEICFEPKWNCKFGSGLRGVFTIHHIEKSERIKFYTFGDGNTTLYLESMKNNFLEPHISTIPKCVQFEYDFPLSVPNITPRLDILTENQKHVEASHENDNILFYGMLEGTASVHGNRVVYDPQSPSNPKSFSSTNSTAKELAVVTNLSEARLLSGKNDIDGIAEFFFVKEKTNVLVIKMGAKGALVFTAQSTKESIAVYKTESVWPIGSGDVFAASFAYYWFKGNDPVRAAKHASWNTACYCDTKSYDFKNFENGDYQPLLLQDFPSGQIYLAGPFFTFTQRWLVEQIYNSLKAMNLNVFSPWHDVGHGEASFVVPLDLAGLDQSSLIFAILDGLDSGTLFEIGYGIAKKTNVVGYVENETSESVKMLVGTDCILENDLTTALYKALWKLAE